MKLIRLNNYEIEADDELLLLKPFRKLFNQDRSGSKKNFYDFLMVLYFTYDLRSDFQYIVDEKERLKEVCEANGIPLYKFSPLEKECITLYRKMMVTSSSQLLQSTRIAVEKVRKFLENDADPSLMDNNNKPVFPINTIVSAIKQIPQLAKDLIDAEKAVNKELTEQNSVRGSQELTVTEIWRQQGI